MEDFLSVLRPCAAGQPAASTTALAGGAALRVQDMEGADLLLLSPGKLLQAKDGDLMARGEIVFARRNADGTLRLAITNGPGAASCGAWSLDSFAPVSLAIKGGMVAGESSGEAHEAQITLSPTTGPVAEMRDGQPFPATRVADQLTLKLPAGPHTFSFKIASN